MPKTDPRVDSYIQKAQPFAQPILKQIRKVVHEACPGVQETMKWSHPHFDYKGIFCSMAAFKEHAAFNFWKGSLLSQQLPKVDDKAMGQFGRLTAVADLPATASLTRIVKTAAKLNDAGVKIERAPRTAKPAPKAPADLLAALKKNAKALKTYEGFAPGQKREYVTWIIDAKQDATRASRIEQAVEWMAEGKQRNWKYMK